MAFDVPPNGNPADPSYPRIALARNACEESVAMLNQTLADKKR